jgi:hypothetical protein
MPSKRVLLLSGTEESVSKKESDGTNYSRKRIVRVSKIGEDALESMIMSAVLRGGEFAAGRIVRLQSRRR